jgi:hypothetical protein
VNLLPAALLRVRCTPYRQGFTPSEILYGWPPPIIPRLGEETLTKISNHDLLQSLQGSSTDSQTNWLSCPKSLRNGETWWPPWDSLGARRPGVGKKTPPWQPRGPLARSPHCDLVHSHSHQGCWKTLMDSSYSV